jgi:hypothetical protein
MTTPRVAYINREEFLADYWVYKPGQHVAILGPTDYGKTFLCHQLLTYTATPELPAVELVRKPRDKEVSKWGRESGFRVVHQWPPPLDEKLKTTLRSSKPPGWIVWPRHQMVPRLDDPAHAHVFRAAILDAYKAGDTARHETGRIIVADEMMGLVDIGLKPECVTVLTMGRTMPTGLWCSTQRPRNVPMEVYSQSQHLFLGFNADAADRKRYGEIGGVDPKLVFETVSALNWHEWLYIKRKGRNGSELAIIGK